MNNTVWHILKKHNEAIEEIRDTIYDEFHSYATIEDADALMLYKILNDFLN